uniref:Uncharacterized protein n=1 Tax=uncultured delta proteobacterium HF0070_10I02 TaxID=710824 RepID=E0XS27_9DELT|nr:hypothetical protein [uncultured delta proteobacterium HF0070_10I02]
MGWLPTFFHVKRVFGALVEAALGRLRQEAGVFRDVDSASFSFDCVGHSADFPYLSRLWKPRNAGTVSTGHEW